MTIEWAQKGKAAVLVGGQFGSEGKGNVAAWLAHNACQCGVNVATTNAGAQAGHTTQYRDGRKFICYHLPTVGVIDVASRIYANGGSIIDVDQLKREMEAIRDVFGTGPHGRLHIHPRAAVITDDMKKAAKDINHSMSTLAFGSTQKGVGQTIAAKTMRKATLAGGHNRLDPFVESIDLNAELRNGAAVTVEIPQGTGLGLIHGYSYPYTTSRDCWVGSGLNDAGIHPHFLGRVAMVVRTYPIRVGHFFNELGEKLGDSGPFFPDGKELEWSHFPRVEPERTTVTKRIRRIAKWSDDQYRSALALNRPDIVALTFCDYLRDIDHFHQRLDRMFAAEMETMGRTCRRLYSVGPCVEDVFDNVNDLDAWFAQRGGQGGRSVV